MPVELTPAGAPINDCWKRIGVWGKGDCPELEQRLHCRNCPTYGAAALDLLDRDLPPNYLGDWAEHFARPKATTEALTLSSVIFRIGTEWLALATSVMLEVAELRRIHSLPHRRNQVILGLVSIRGELLITVSLGVALGLEKAPEVKRGTQAVPARLLVVRREGSRLVFPVDEVHGIQRHDPRDLQPLPGTLAKAVATYARGILPFDGKSVGLLDDQLLFHTLNRSVA